MGYTPNTLRWISYGLRSDYDTPNSIIKRARAYEKLAELGVETVAFMDDITLEEAATQIEDYKRRATELKAQTFAR